MFRFYCKNLKIKTVSVLSVPAAVLVLSVMLAGLTACDKADSDKGASTLSGVASDTDNGLAEAMSKIQMMKSMPYPISTLSGDFLAGRIASDNGDMEAAAEFFARALQEDAKNPMLLQSALPVAVAAGNIEKAYEIAKEIHDSGSGDSHLGVVVLIAKAVKDKDIPTAWGYADKMNPEGLGMYLRPLIRAWLAAGDKSPLTAETILVSEIKKQPLLSALYLTHLGLLSEYRNDTEKAAEFYKRALNQQFSVRMASLVGSFYENTNRIGSAQEMYRRLGDEFHSMSYAETAMLRIDERKMPPRNISDVGDGIAMALFDLSGVLHQERASRLALLFSEVAAYLKPDDDFNNILLGDIFNTAGMPEKAVGKYSLVKPESDIHELTSLRMADTLESMGKIDETLKIIDSMKVGPKLMPVLQKKKADTLRRAERYKEAIPVYDEVIKSVRRDDKEDWTVYYGRGLCYEQIGNWPEAEKDLVKALEISPNQSLILNYLGYTWADKGINIDKALSYIKKASELEPDDGYIADSMGWVLFRLGKYKEAVSYMEHAVELIPNDATINDHLGDVYWHVNRKIEAKFQWQRALDDEKDEKQRSLIREKLEKGFISTDADKKITVTTESK